MLDALQDIASAWRTILHVSEWTGLSVGALVGCAVLFVYVPLARKLVVALGVLVLVVWITAIHCDRVGRADVEAQWADARKAAIAAAQERDAMLEQKLQAKYQPQLAALQAQADERKARSDTYERQIVALLAKAPGGSRCELGAAALRVRTGK